MKIAIVIIVTILVGMMVWWKVSFPSGTWRYKMTVTVETPEGIISGSAVRQVFARVSPKVSPHAGGSASVKGEAVVVDLGMRGVVFALLKGPKLGVDYGASLPFFAFPWKRGGLTSEGITYYSRLKAEPKRLEPDLYPQMVWFKDLNDPMTVENIMVLRPCSKEDGGDWQHHLCVKEDRFAQAFGEGVKMKSVTIEMTDEQVTRGIVNSHLAWLSALKGGYLHGGDTSRGAPLGLYGGNFQKGLNYDD